MASGPGAVVPVQWRQRHSTLFKWSTSSLDRQFHKSTPHLRTLQWWRCEDRDGQRGGVLRELLEWLVQTTNWSEAWVELVSVRPRFEAGLRRRDTRLYWVHQLNMLWNSYDNLTRLFRTENSRLNNLKGITKKIPPGGGEKANDPELRKWSKYKILRQEE